MKHEIGSKIKFLDVCTPAWDSIGTTKNVMPVCVDLYYQIEAYYPKSGYYELIPLRTKEANIFVNSRFMEDDKHCEVV